MRDAQQAGSANVAGHHGHRDHLMVAARLLAICALALVLSWSAVSAAPNRDCTSAEHAAYHATGPDGLEYATWHPQVQEDVWCYFRHEHGSDPAAVHPNLVPLFGYAAARAGTAENHEGFKVHAFRDSQNHGWAITLHQGSSSVGRACVRFHELDYLVVDLTSGEVLADLSHMGDFGLSMSNDGATYLYPPACPTQAADAEADGSFGVRQLPIQSQGGVLYEPWRVDARFTVLGIAASNTTINVTSPLVICATLSCATPQTTNAPAAGSFRFLSLNTAFALVAGPGHSGTFWTDPKGRTTVTSGTPGSVRQYLKPGVNLKPFQTGVSCYPFGAWVLTYRCDGQPINNDMNINGMLRSPN